MGRRIWFSSLIASVKDMSATDPLSPLLALGEVAVLAERATAAIARVHRRPAALRKPELIVGESVLRGARTSTLIDGHPAPVDKEPAGAFGAAVSVYGLLAPGVIQDNAAVFRRSPANVVARMDVAAGGPGVPTSEDGPQRLQALARLLGDDRVNAAVLPQVVHAEIVARELFGERSGLIGRAASRLVAVATGVDPRGLAVPEIYLNRHRAEYREALAGWSRDTEGMRAALEFLLRAWIQGAAEADAIVQAA